MEYLEIGKCHVKQGKLPIAFCDLLQAVASALKIATPMKPTRSVVERDEDCNAEESLRKISFRTVTEEFQNRNVFSRVIHHMTMSSQKMVFPVGCVLS